MDIQEKTLKPFGPVASGRVRSFSFPDGGPRVSQITTFCPDEIGPGPIHMYLIESDALILVDAGIPTAMAKAFFYMWRSQPMPPEVEDLAPDHSMREFVEALDALGRRMSDIDLIVISHGHPDHFLMARSILTEARAPVAAHVLDTPEICNPWGLLSVWYARQNQMTGTGVPSAWSTRSSFTEDMLQRLEPEVMGMGLRVDAPIFRAGPLRLRGSAVAGVEVEHLPGHTPGSLGVTIAHNGRKILLCGDVLLNPITPHPDNLLVYLRTLEELSGRDDVDLVLPAHGEEIRDLRPRVAFLRAHHERRLRMTYEACAEETSVWGVATKERYFDTYVDPRKFNFMAASEALVHMELLHMVDGLYRTDIRNGEHYFRKADTPFEELYGRITELVADRSISAMMRF